MSLYPEGKSEPFISVRGLVYKGKGELPPEKALVVIVFGKPKVLMYIGPGLDFIYEDGYMQNHFEEDVEIHIPSDGLYIWTGQVVERTSFAEDEVEYWIEGSFEPASRSQWDKYLEGTPPWDTSLYLVDSRIRDLLLEECEEDHTKSKHWPPDRFHREEVI